LNDLWARRPVKTAVATQLGRRKVLKRGSGASRGGKRSDLTGPGRARSRAISAEGNIDDRRAAQWTGKQTDGWMVAGGGTERESVKHRTS